MCFGHHYAHLQENKTYVTACGVLRCFCWMWLVFFSLTSQFAHDARSQKPKNPFILHPF